MAPYCNFCKKEFSTNYNLNKHMRIKHNTCVSTGKVFNFKCLEEKCSSSFEKSSELVKHLRCDHQFSITEEEKNFHNIEEFFSWKNDVEVKETCNYITSSRKKQLAFGDEVQYFICNRSVNKKARINAMKNIHQRKRALKSQGSSKLQHGCISKIILRKHENLFRMSRIVNHYGHTNDIQHIRIDHLSRQKLALKMLEGVSKARVLDDTRKKITDLKRTDLLTRQDLDNIKRSYGIEMLDGVKHKEDAISVQLWVDECKVTFIPVYNSQIILKKLEITKS